MSRLRRMRIDATHRWSWAKGLVATAAGVVVAIGTGAGAGLDAASDIPGIYRLGAAGGGDAQTDGEDIVVVRVIPAAAAIGVDPSRDAAM